MGDGMRARALEARVLALSSASFSFLARREMRRMEMERDEKAARVEKARRVALSWVAFGSD